MVRDSLRVMISVLSIYELARYSLLISGSTAGACIGWSPVHRDGHCARQNV